MMIKIAAFNSSEQDKECADVVCSGKNDEQVINAQIERLTKGGTILFSDGDYYLDSFSQEGNTAVYFGYNNGQARVINIVGSTENKAYNTHFGTCFHVTKTAIDSCRTDDTYRVFSGTKQRPAAPGDFFTMTYVNNVNFSNSIYFFTMRQNL